jgi:hypothetical protein
VAGIPCPCQAAPRRQALRLLASPPYVANLSSREEAQERPASKSGLRQRILEVDRLLYRAGLPSRLVSAPPATAATAVVLASVRAPTSIGAEKKLSRRRFISN